MRSNVVEPMRYGRHVTAHCYYALLEDAAFGEPPAFGGLEPRVQLLPDAAVGPVLDLVVRIALQVEALDLRRARADEGEAALVMRVDQLLGRGGRLDQDAEPAERVDAREFMAHARRDRGPRDAVEAVAAGDE